MAPSVGFLPCVCPFGCEGEHLEISWTVELVCGQLGVCRWGGEEALPPVEEWYY